MWLACRWIFNRLQWEFVVSRSDLNRIVVFFSFIVQCDQWLCVLVWNGEGLWIECLWTDGWLNTKFQIEILVMCVCARAETAKWNERGRRKNETCTNIEIETKTKALGKMVSVETTLLPLLVSPATKQQWRTNASAIDTRIVWAALFDFSRQFNKIRDLNYASLVLVKQFNKSTLENPLISIKWNCSRVLFQMQWQYD